MDFPSTSASTFPIHRGSRPLRFHFVVVSKIGGFTRISSSPSNRSGVKIESDGKLAVGDLRPTISSSLLVVHCTFSFHGNSRCCHQSSLSSLAVSTDLES
ncbi:unnamed protein product [Linum trigynum]|uniref:Uncharacterized protein n=1 Tax=Linum trigynum TaxID=586398 RepID=A0AAV2D2S1_9ROSI